MIFITEYQHEKSKNVEKSHLGKVLVEKDGYITLKKQIEMLINAGERLHQERLDNYAYTDYIDIDDAVVHPATQPNFDLVDAQLEYNNALKRYKNAQEQAKVQKAKESEPTLTTPAGDPPEALRTKGSEPPPAESV